MGNQRSGACSIARDHRTDGVPTPEATANREACDVSGILDRNGFTLFEQG